MLPDENIITVGAELMERHVSVCKCVRQCVFFEFVQRMTEELTASAPISMKVKVVPTRVVYLTVEPPATVQLSLCSAGFMMSWTIFSSLCLSGRVGTWLVRPANESDCTITDCGSHVKRVLTRRFFLSCERVFRTLTILVAGFLNEAWQPGTHADFSVVGCDEYIERKLLSCTTLSCSRHRGRVGDYLSICH